MNHLQGNIDINANINFKTGNKSKTIISVIKVKKSAYEAKAKDKYDVAVSGGLECFTKAHVSLHAFQDCDSVGAYAGLGISKAFNKWQKNMTI